MRSVLLTLARIALVAALVCGLVCGLVYLATGGAVVAQFETLSKALGGAK